MMEGGLVYVPGTPEGIGFGLPHPHLQALKSAAGWYIGTLTRSNWGTDDEPKYVWEPNMRDSQDYWATRDEAEATMIKGNYEVKF